MKVSRMLFLAALLAAGPGPTATEAAPQFVNSPRPMAAPTAGDRVFLTDTVLDELLGEALGEQARERPGTDRFVGHAAQMAAVHTLRLGAARGLAVIHGVRPPGALDADRLVILTRLSSRDGPGYERAYARVALELHQRILERLEAQARGGDDPDLRREASLGVAPAMSLVRLSDTLWNALTPAGL